MAIFANVRTNSRTGERAVMTAAASRHGGQDRPLIPFPSGRSVALYAAMGGFLGLIGPFGSYLNDGSPATRIVYWIGTSLLSCIGFDLLLRVIAPRARAFPRWLIILIAVMLANLPLSVAIHTAAVWIWPQMARIGWLQWYGQALLASALYVAAHVFLSSSRRPPPTQSPPLRLGRDVLCLQMEDHYVRAHGRDGSRLVHASLGRAAAELKGVEGMQVHRSWWVARDAVESVLEDNRNIRLRLRNGLEAPVGRTRIAALRAAGWLSEAKPTGTQLNPGTQY